jgi:hypothetical protein
MSAADVSGIDLISADNATNSSANRAANPITAGENSFEKWIKARVGATAPDNYVKLFKVWGDGAVQAETTLKYGVTATGATPTASASSVATTDFANAVVGSKATWHDGELTAEGHLTDYLVLQLQTTPSAAAGNWTQETINYQYTEA